MDIDVNRDRSFLTEGVLGIISLDLTIHDEPKIGYPDRNVSIYFS